MGEISHVGGSAPEGSPLIGAATPPDLHIMSWNIRRRMDGLAWRKADRWDVRAPALRTLLQTELPTMLCVQEALPSQASFVLESLGDTYRFVGHGRDAAQRGEGCPIFYDAARLELLEWNQAALSETPARPGSRSWGNIIPRTLVSARFRDRATSRTILAVNTHLDHLSSRSRLRSASAIRAVVAASRLPAVVTGDLNDGATSATLHALLSGGTLVDTWARARARASEEWGTFSNYRAPRRDGKRIDWMLATPDFQVTTAAINPRRYGGQWPSDHLPVQAVLTLPQGGETH